MSFADKKGITITGGFKLNSPQPLDVRDVVETLDDLAELVSSNAAYEGMIVWVKSEKKSKQYDGKEWKDIASENASGPTTVDGLVDDVEISKYYGDTGDEFKGYSIDLRNKKSGETIDTAILNVDTSPIEDSENLITSGAVKEAIKNITVGGEIPDNIITEDDFVDGANLKEVVFKTDFADSIDLKNIASKSDIPENIITKGDFVDGADLTQIAFKDELFSGNYSDLNGKPDNLVKTDDFVENADLKKVVFEDKLSDYAKTTDLFNKDYNELTNKPDLTNFAEKDELFSKNYDDLTNKPNLNDFAKKGELFSKSYNDLTDRPNLDNFALKTEIPSTDNFASVEYVNSRVSLLTGDVMNEYVNEASTNPEKINSCNLVFCTQDASSGIKYRLGTLYYVLNNKFQPMQGSGSIEKTAVSTVLSISHNKNSRYEVSSEVLSGIKLSCSIVNTNGSAVNGKVKVSGTSLEVQEFDPTYNNGGVFYIDAPDINRSSASTNTYSITATKLSDDDLNTYSVRNGSATITIYQPTLFGNDGNLVHYDKKTGTFEANISVGSQVFLYTTGTIASAASDENFLYSVQVEDLGSITLDFAVNGVSNLVYRKYRLGGAAGINDTTVKFYVR